ncbi:MAG: hypothetical protein F6K22_02510 [Okeania sp. SIO2F4]|nr:hypothetical protein [Okeania sp. SIO2F4]
MFPVEIHLEQSNNKEYLIKEICHQIFTQAFSEYSCPPIITTESLIQEVVRMTGLLKLPKICLILEKERASTALIQLALRLQEHFSIVWAPETGMTLSGFPDNQENYKQVVKAWLQKL